jgi:hypothetical protein
MNEEVCVDDIIHAKTMTWKSVARVRYNAWHDLSSDTKQSG